MIQQCKCPFHRIHNLNIRDIRKVRKRQRQYSEFGHTQGEISTEEYISIQGGVKLRNFDGFLSFTLSFFFHERLHCCYIDSHCSYLYTATILLLEPCGLNAEIQHFALSFSISQ